MQVTKVIKVWVRFIKVSYISSEFQFREIINTFNSEKETEYLVSVNTCIIPTASVLVIVLHSVSGELRLHPAKPVLPCSQRNTRNGAISGTPCQSSDEVSGAPEEEE